MDDFEIIKSDHGAQIAKLFKEYGGRLLVINADVLNDYIRQSDRLWRKFKAPLDEKSYEIRTRTSKIIRDMDIKRMKLNFKMLEEAYGEMNYETLTWENKDREAFWLKKMGECEVVRRSASEERNKWKAEVNQKTDQYWNSDAYLQTQVIPSVPGVYLFKRNQKIEYIGESLSVNSRVERHIRLDTKQGRKLGWFEDYEIEIHVFETILGKKSVCPIQLKNEASKKYWKRVERIKKRKRKRTLKYEKLLIDRYKDRHPLLNITHNW